MPYKPKITTRGISTTTVTTDSIPKNAPMTNDELDSNFLNIRDASIGIASDDSTVIDIGLGNTLKVIGAGGVTTAVSGQSITIDGSGISGGGTNSFSTIAVTGQSSVVADSTTDTLTLAAGDGITITTSAGTDTITITNSSPNNTGNLPFAKSIGTTANSGGSDTIATGASDHDMYFKTSGDGTYNFINTTSEVGIIIADSGLATGGIASGKLSALGVGGTGNVDLTLLPLGTGTIDLRVPTSTTIGANGAASALTANPVGYLKIKVNGTTYQLPYYNI